jgi:glycerophosphoryl diester phosphodiesterase
MICIKYILYRLLIPAACIFSNPIPKPKHNFIVVSHRGDHTHAPEKTLAAYANAIAAGADYVEIDLRTTADSQLVIMHDASINRMTDDSGLVRSMTWEKLHTLKVRDRAHPEWGQQEIPLFTQVLETMPLMVSLPANVRGADSFTAFLNKYHPDILDGDFDEYTPEMIRAASAFGVMVLPDIQRPGENAGLWDAAIGKGLQGLQTDHPGELVEYLKKKGIR